MTRIAEGLDPSAQRLITAWDLRRADVGIGRGRVGAREPQGLREGAAEGEPINCRDLSRRRPSPTLVKCRSSGRRNPRRWRTRRGGSATPSLKTRLPMGEGFSKSLTPASRGIECVFALTDGAFSYQYAEEVSKDVRAHKGGVSEAEWRQLARESTTRLSFADFHETRARRGIDDGWDLSFVRMESGDEGEDVVKFAIADCFNFASQPVAPQERSALLKSVADPEQDRHRRQARAWRGCDDQGNRRDLPGV